MEFMVVYQPPGIHSAQALQNPLGFSEVASQTLDFSRTELWWEVWREGGDKALLTFFCPGTHLRHEEQFRSTNWGTWAPAVTSIVTPSKGKTHLKRTGQVRPLQRATHSAATEKHQEEISRGKAATFLRDLEWDGMAKMGGQYRKRQLSRHEKFSFDRFSACVCVGVELNFLFF